MRRMKNIAFYSAPFGNNWIVYTPLIEKPILLLLIWPLSVYLLHITLKGGGTVCTCMSWLCSEREGFVQKCWKDVRLGDFIQLSCDEVIPADIVLLQSSDEDNICYIQTSSLDGETSLKQRQVPEDVLQQYESSGDIKVRPVYTIMSHGWCHMTQIYVIFTISAYHISIILTIKLSNHFQYPYTVIYT